MTILNSRLYFSKQDIQQGGCMRTAIFTLFFVVVLTGLLANGVYAQIV